MIKVLFEFQGKPIQLSDIADPMQRGGLSTWGDIVHSKVDDLKCPKCDDACHISIILGIGDSARFSHRLIDDCHPEFCRLVNDTLPLFLKKID